MIRVPVAAAENTSNVVDPGAWEPDSTRPPEAHGEALPDGSFRLTLSGDWLLQRGLPALDLLPSPPSSKITRLYYEASQLGEWKSGLLAFLIRCHDWCVAQKIPCDESGLPHSIQEILTLSRAVPEREVGKRGAEEDDITIQIGESVLGGLRVAGQFLEFLGECTLSVGRMLRRRARFRAVDTWHLLQQCGADALPIVALISFLVGLILAFVGAVQLEQFGASIFVANLVGLAMFREMGAMMAGIILCGRNGAAFAAQLGSMKVNEEIAAFRTFGISPNDFLVLPRLIAMSLMMPLLVVFADFIGVAGGLVVAMGMLNISFIEYFNQTSEAIRLADALLGVAKGCVFGMIVALTGCFRGMTCGNNASAVGDAATSAVVMGITFIILADAVFAVLCNILGI